MLKRGPQSCPLPIFSHRRCACARWPATAATPGARSCSELVVASLSCLAQGAALSVKQRHRIAAGTWCAGGAFLQSLPWRAVLGLLLNCEGRPAATFSRLSLPRNASSWFHYLLVHCALLAPPVRWYRLPAAPAAPPSFDCCVLTLSSLYCCTLPPLALLIYSTHKHSVMPHRVSHGRQAPLGRPQAFGERVWWAAAAQPRHPCKQTRYRLQAASSQRSSQRSSLSIIRASIPKRTARTLPPNGPGRVGRGVALPGR